MNDKEGAVLRRSVLLLVFVLSFALYYICTRGNTYLYQSDNAFPIVAGKDVMAGNILLKDWYGARNTLYVLDILYGLLGAILGYSFNLVFVVSALLWACFLTLIAGILLDRYGGDLLRCIMRICLVCLLCFSSCFVWQGSGIFAGVHFDVVLIGMFYSWVISKETESCKNDTPRLVIASMLLFLAIWADNLTPLLIVLPILAALAFELLFCTKKEVKRRLYIVKHLILTIVLFAAARGSMLFLQNTGRMITTSPADGVTVPEYSELFTNVAYFLKSVLYLFDCDFFGRYIGIESWRLILRFLLLAILFAGLLWNVKTIFCGMFNKILLFCIVVEGAVIVFTGDGADKVVGPSWTSRLLVALFFSLVLLFAQIDWQHVVDVAKIEISGTRWRALGAAAMLLLLGINLQEQFHYPKGGANSFEETLKPLADTLMDRGLTKGFGIYSLSSAVTLASDFGTDVRHAYGADLSFSAWLSKKTDDWNEAHFMILDGSGWGEMTEESVIDSVGTPDEKILVNGATILVWDKNILPYIHGSGYPGATMDGWWSMETGQTEKTVEITNRHFYSDFAANEEGYFTSNAAGMLVFGPYRPMSAGIYDITFEYDYEETLEPGDALGQVDVNSNAQKVKFTSCPVIAGVNSVTLKDVQVLPECTDLETRFYANVEGVTVRRIVIERTGM